MHKVAFFYLNENGENMQDGKAKALPYLLLM